MSKFILSSTFFIVLISFFASCNTNDSSNYSENLQGKWSCELNICSSSNQQKTMTLSLELTGKTLSVFSNDIACNKCSKTCSVSASQILFEAEGETCTEMACANEFSYCNNPTDIPSLFSNMEYNFIDKNTLNLSQGNNKISLKRD